MYIKILGGFAYFCAIMNLFSHKIIAFRVHDKTDSDFVIQTLRQALNKRNLSDSLLFHSGRGSQYTSAAFRRFCDENHITQSFANISEVKIAAFEYIEGFYNSKRPHSANQMFSPNEKDLSFFLSILLTLNVLHARKHI